MRFSLPVRTVPEQLVRSEEPVLSAQQAWMRARARQALQYNATAAMLMAPCSEMGGTASSTVASVNASLVAALADLYGAVQRVSVACFPSEEDLVAYYRRGENWKHVLAAIVFDDTRGILGGHPQTVRYRVRMRSSKFMKAPTAAFKELEYGPDGSVGEYNDYLLPLMRSVDFVVGCAAVGGLTNATMCPITSASTGSNMPALEPQAGSPATALPWPSMFIQQFPFPEFNINVAASVLPSIVPLYLTLIMSLQVRVSISSILQEKEAKVTAALRTAGLQPGAYWASWLALFGTKSGLIVVASLAIMFLAQIFSNSNFLIVLVFYLLFVVATLVFVFILAALPLQARVGSVIAFMGYWIASLPYYGLIQPSVPYSAILGTSLVLVPTAFSMGNAILVEAERTEVGGVHWDNITDRHLTSINMDIATLMWVTVVDIVWMAALAWYLDKVVPNENTSHQHPFFCCSSAYWTGRSAVADAPNSRLASEGPGQDKPDVVATPLLEEDSDSTDTRLGSEAGKQQPSLAAALGAAAFGAGDRAGDQERVAAAVANAAPVIEPVAQELHCKAVIQVRGLSKVFTGAGENAGDRAVAGPGPGEKGVVVANSDVSFDLYEGQVSVILGKNGAGKTVLFSMLSGLLTPTSGDAIMYGRSVVNNVDGVRELIGLCPQHDALIEQLTVMEHCVLFAGIKGIPEAAAKQRARDLLAEVGLEGKVDSLATELSGGMKRKLCVVLAFVGQPRIVFLDEPTSGVDAVSRRAIWGLIQRYKQHSVIVLSTHHMEEAERLGSRIVFMSKGRLKALGSPLFLKQQFGVGYTLTTTVTASAPSSAAAEQVQAVKDLVLRYIPEASLSSVLALSRERDDDVAASSTLASLPPDTTRALAGFVLPLHAKPAFGAMFSELEEEKANFGVADVGLSLTSLEQVFLRMAEAEEMEAATTAEHGTGEQADAAGESLHVRPATFPLPLDEEVADGRSQSLDIEAGHGQQLRSSGTSMRLHASDWKQMTALYRQRLLTMRRTPSLIWVQVFMPVLFTAISLAFATMQDINEQPKPESMDATLVNVRQGAGDGANQFLLSTAVSVAASGATISGAGPGSAALQAWLNGTLAGVNQSLPASVSVQYEPPPASTSDPTAGVFSATTPYTWFLRRLLDSRYVVGAVVAQAVNLTSSGGAESSNPSLGILYNTSLPAGLPSILSAVDTALINSALVSRGRNRSLALSMQYQPMPAVGSDADAETLGTVLSGNLMGMYMAMGLASLCAVYVGTVVKVKSNSIRAMLSIMGMRVPTYWAANWVFDFSMFLIPAAGATAVMAIASSIGAVPTGTLAAFVPLVVLLGVSLPGPSYFASFFFSKDTTAQTWTTMLLLTGSILVWAVNFALSIVATTMSDSSPGLAGASQIIRYCGMALLPPAAFLFGFGQTVIALGTACAAVPEGEPCSLPSPFQWELALGPLVAMAAAVPFWYALILFWDGYFDAWVASASSSPQIPSPSRPLSGRVVGDDDVSAEAARVHERGVEAGDLVVFDIRKVYHTGSCMENADLISSTVAVDGVTVALRRGAVFGLLGHNGAGKTSLMQILTGTCPSTEGAAVMFGAQVAGSVPVSHSVGTRAQAQAIQGYCPQHNAVFEVLTAEEVLTFYCHVKGVPDDRIPALVAGAIRAVGLKSHAKKKVKALSGGNKRKLSLAVAYLGRPRVVTLDEASSGMDPQARRAMWEVVRGARAGRVTICSTHVMEEADALSDSIGIMVKGQLACIGDNQHLKSKYGKGYTVEVQFAEDEYTAASGGAAHHPSLDDRVQSLVASIQRVCPDVEVKERSGLHAVLALWHTRGEAGVRAAESEESKPRLGPLFRLMEEERQAAGLSDYAVSQTSMEQVFLSFAKLQESMEASEAGGSPEPGSRRAVSSIARIL